LTSTRTITLYSGHSEREAWEGYNVIMVILDEIDGFASESAMGSVGKTAGIYDMYRASVDSRFPEFGKILALSFPRYKGSWIQTRYEQIIASKRTVIRREILKLDPDLPDGFEGNEIPVEWDRGPHRGVPVPEDVCLEAADLGREPRPRIHHYTRAFFDNYLDTLSRTACMPPDAIDAFFKDKVKIDDAFAFTTGWSNDDGTF
jgi:hypothetical protein